MKTTSVFGRIAARCRFHARGTTARAPAMHVSADDVAFAERLADAAGAAIRP
jgi:hypothetical protein